MQIAIRARDKQFEPLDNAGVTLQIKTPDKRQIDLVADTSERAAGTYRSELRAP